MIVIILIDKLNFIKHKLSHFKLKIESFGDKIRKILISTTALQRVRILFCLTFLCKEFKASIFAALNKHLSLFLKIF